MDALFQAPIPGQSLTDTPRNAPWERPSEIDTVEDAVKHYVGKLADQDVMDDIAVVVQMGADLKTLTETIVMSGAMKGLHTVETAMLAGPVIATFIKAAMQSYGLNVPETPVSFEESAKEREKKRLNMLLQDAVEKAAKNGGKADPGVDFLKELTKQETGGEGLEQAPVEEEPMNEPDLEAGIMSRGGNL